MPDFLRKDGLVSFTISDVEFQRLLVGLGILTGMTWGENKPDWTWIKLANAINEGNPNWIPYKTGTEANDLPDGK